MVTEAQQRTYEDLPKEVRTKVDNLPDGVWSGPLNGYHCRECGENSWRETGPIPDYSHKYRHETEGFRCLFCGSSGGIIEDWRVSNNTDADVVIRAIGAVTRD